jgi:hypothetical protein
MYRHRIPQIAVALTVLVALLPIGCGANGLAPVTGSVMYKGQPAKGATLHFRRDGETAEESANFPIGVVDEEGKFYLEVPGVGYGAPPGKYKVLVRWAPSREESVAAPNESGKPKKSKKSVVRSAAEIRRDPNSDTDRLGFRYFKAKEPLLFAEIKPGSNTLEPFELKD